VRAADPEYLLPTDFDVSLVGRRLPGRLELGLEMTRIGQRTFFDTFDRRLRNRGLKLVHEDGFLRLFDERGREIAALASPCPAAPIRCDRLEPGPLRAALAPVCDVRALLPTVRMRSRRRTFPVLDGRSKTVARLVAEDAVIAGGAADGAALRPRLHARGVRGYETALTRVRRTLEDRLALVTATESVQDEAIVRAGGSPQVSASHVAVAPDPGVPAERATVALAQRLHAAIEANVPGALADVDTEFLHDMRVAVRRTRSLQRELKAVFPQDELARFRAEFRWLQQVTGASRDLDVYLLEFDEFAAALPSAERHHLEPLRKLLTERRVRERTRMESALRSGRARGLLDSWAAFLERLPDASHDDRPRAAAPIREVAAGRIKRVYRQMLRMGGAIDDSSPAVALHELRKKGKELRYLLEFFSPLFPADVTRPMVRTLKALQDTLGRFQDREVQAMMIRSLGREVAVHKDGANALMAMGVLVERLERQQSAARAEFAERFAAFAAGPQRALVRKTFG
jgi:CHAD domain-containing protein